MGPALIYPWRKMRRSRAPSTAPGTFFVTQSWADSITDMPGSNLRQAQGRNQPGWQIETQIPGEADDIARPSDRNRHGADGIFEDEVPADDPRAQFAERRVGVGIGTPADRNGRRHFGVAQPGECTGDRAEEKRERHRRPRVHRRGMPGQDEDARADDS